MNEDYLWDRSGEPEPEIVRLEQLLGQLQLPEDRRRPLTPVASNKSQAWRGWKLAAAAVIVFGAAAALFLERIHTVGPVTSWQLSLAGSKPSAVHTGQIIETAASTQATIQSDLVGMVDIRPDTRLRVLSAPGGEQRLALDRGTIHAFIWAPPTNFVVDTPSARTVDLGCQYTLHVDSGGTGFLTVETGWVAFQWHNTESFIPAGAACTTRPGRGPDPPYFLDAPAALISAMARFESTGSSAALDSALSASRPRDALTLWHLLARTQGSQRAEVFDRFTALVILPPAVTREAILRGGPNAMDAAWDALQLGDTGWWRKWKRQW
ncbi:MAG: FecR domain-containing protein [Acidobacteriaceae bacterium]|nr:FecR domain-containing protein [Acidobacteriaceae bacterium]